MHSPDSYCPFNDSPVSQQFEDHFPSDDLNTTDAQVSIAERLQLKWLQRMETLIDAGILTDTGMAILARVLMANGWNLDPKRLPKGLRDKLTSHFDPKEFEDDEPDLPAGVVGRISGKAS